MLLGPLLLVILTPTTALAAWAVVRSIGGARSRAARSTLGEALDRVPDGGGAVTLRGLLVAERPLCKRFEDDGEGAVVTAAALLPEGESTAEASARAGGLALHVGGAVVRIEGPVRVIAGSREATIGSRVAALRGRMLERIGAVDPEVAWMLSRRPGQVRLRSLSSGDLVRVSGRLQRADTPIEGGSRGYRDAGVPWCLVPEETRFGVPPVIRAAFEGAPGGALVRRAVLTGIVVGVCVAVAIGLLMLPPALPPPGTMDGGKSPPSEPQVERPRDDRLDPVVAALDDGDFAKASAAWPAEIHEGLFAAEIHALAGRFEEGAASLEPFSEPVVGNEVKACLVDAFLARAPAPRATTALAHLRKLVDGLGAARSARLACSLLLADLLPPTERLPILDALPREGRGPLTRLRALLTLEAGRVPSVIPEDGADFPAASTLLDRPPHRFEVGQLGVHITDALARLPNAHGDRRFRMREAARAAYVLSAVGELAGAQRAVRRARDDAGSMGTEQLAALETAIALRAGKLLDAQHAAAVLPQDHDLVLVTTLLLGGKIDESIAFPGSEARAFLDLLKGGPQVLLGPVTNIVHRAFLMQRPGAELDGERLFLVVPYIQIGRATLLGWVRSGNPRRVWRTWRSKGVLAPYAPVDFLARLSERHHMAAALESWELASKLDQKLRQARKDLLRREIAGLVHVIQHAGSPD